MRRPIKKKILVEPDIKHSSILVSKFINYIMKHGKKTIAMKIVYDALKLAEEKLNKPELEIFEQAIQNAAPNMELKSRRIGGANYQVPIDVRPERKVALAMRWIIDSSRSQKGKPMAIKLSEEL